MYLLSITINQARRRGEGKRIFLTPLLGMHLRNGDMWLKVQKGEPEVRLFFGYFLCCLCVWTKMVPENSIYYLFHYYLFMWGNIPPSGIFEAVQRILF